MDSIGFILWLWHNALRRRKLERLSAVEGKVLFGYKYGIENQPDGLMKNTTQIGIKYLIEINSNAAGQYYKSKSLIDFEKYAF